MKQQNQSTRTLLHFLKTALLPIGTTMYIWGGGWNEEDTGAGIEATTIGLSPRWAKFAKKQDAFYDYKKYRYRIHDGLDCSGYVGWVLYNTLETESGKSGYVMSAEKMAETFAKRGWGDYIPASEKKDYKPGDIVSMKGHVWISLGTCSDGSVVLVHASPPGVSLCGTCLKDKNGKSEAVCLAESYMKMYYLTWYQRYPECSRGDFYLNGSIFRWNTLVLPDKEKIQDKSSKEVLHFLYSHCIKK